MQWFTGIKFAYDIQLHDGNDFLYASGLNGSAGLFVQMGNGDNGLAVDNVRLDGANVLYTGNGNDTVSIGGGKMKWAAFDLGGGDDRMVIYGTEFGDVVFNGGGGTDSLGLLAIQWHSFPGTAGFESVYSTLMPIANNDVANVGHGQSVTVNVAANDQAIIGILDPSTVQITSQPKHGTATNNGDGTITYTSDTGSTAPRDSFTYTIRSSTGAVSNQATVTLILPTIPDTTGPVPTITTTAADPNNLASIPFKIAFDENVTGFDQTDVAVTNGTLSGFTQVDDKTFTFNVAPTADGAVTVSVAAGAAQDKAGNASSAASKTVTSDRTAPTATISSSATNPTNLASIPITVTFNENVTGFALADVVVGNGTASGFTAVNGSTYTFNVAPTTAGTITVDVAAGVATDLAGNQNTAATQFTIVSDTAAPGVTLATTATSPTNLATIPFTATFTEAVTGFVLSDIGVTNGTATNFQGSGTTYTFDVTPTADGAVTVSIPAGVATDTGGNANIAATPITLTSDTTPPTVAVSSSAPEPIDTNPIPFTVTFSESVSDFTAGGVTVNNGTVINFSGSGTTYTFEVVPSGPNVVVDVSVLADAAHDTAGNGNLVSNTESRTFNGSIISTAITTAATDPTNLSPIPFAVTFGEAVAGFDVSDIQVTNGTASNVQGSDAAYTFDVTPSGDGPVVVDIVAGAATGTVSGNPTSAAQFTITSDTTAPAATISTTATDPTNLSPIPFTVTFSEPVTGFDVSDIQVTNGVASNVQGSGTTYTFDVAPGIDGDVVVAIPAAAATDLAGNDSTAATPVTITSDTTEPTVAISTTESDPTSTNPIPFFAIFSEEVTGFDASDISVTNGTVVGFTGSGTTYEFDVAPSASNVTITVSVGAGAAQDLAGNNNTASSASTIAFNGTIVSAMITTSATDPTNLSPIPFTVTFGESVTGFDVNDINVTNGTASNVQGSGAVYTFDVAPTGDGPVIVDVVAGAATGDVSGGSTSAAQFTLTSDTTAPTATISTTATSPTNLSPIPFTVTFSEAVTGFALAGIQVTNGTASNLQGSGTTYTFDVTPTGDGDVIVSIPAAAATDSAGNDSSAATDVTITSDTTNPTVAVNDSAAGAITGTSSDASGVTGVKVSINNGSGFWNGTDFTGSEQFFDATSSDNFATWSFNFAPGGPFTVHAQATDAAGNVGEITNNTVTVT